MSRILSKVGKKKKELLERKIGGKKSKVGSALTRAFILFQLQFIYKHICGG